MLRISVLCAIGLLAAQTTGASLRRFDSLQPTYAHDANTPKDCSLWWNSDDGLPCNTVLGIAGITVNDLIKLNPSMTSCNDWKADRSYCIKVSATITTVTTTPATTTTPGNGITTPEPTQPGMVTNCNRFYAISAGDTCAVIASKVGVTVAQLAEWNTQIGGTACTGIWAGYNICTGVIGTTTTAAPATTTAPSNAVTTPQPIQAGMISSCSKFYLVVAGDTCAVIASKQGVTVAQLATWNTGIGGTACTGMWAGYYLCVGESSQTTTAPATTTAPSNAVTTPQPIQTGMVATCKKFHFVTSGQTCAVIATLYGITTANFITWNPAAGTGCTGLWANTYACVGV